MGGADVTQDSMFSYQTLSDCVPESHPLRKILGIANPALREMDATFEAMYADSGRDSIPPEQLLRGLLLRSLYGLRSERLLCEQLGYNMLFRWFVGLSLNKKPWDHPTYTKNRNGLVVDTRLTQANGFVERAAALWMLENNALRPLIPQPAIRRCSCNFAPMNRGGR